jgi:hypothetical protein
MTTSWLLASLFPISSTTASLISTSCIPTKTRTFVRSTYVCWIAAICSLHASMPEQNSDSSKQASTPYTESNKDIQFDKKRSPESPRSVMAVNQENRIKANIAADALNRISVVNDRIIQVFGDQDAYELIIDETIGQVFIKPTEANGNKPLSLSFVTASYITQDLLLTPTSMDAATLLFRNIQQKRPTDDSAPDEVLKQQQVGTTKRDEPTVDIMRTWIVNTDAYSDGSNPPDERSRPGCTITLSVWRDFHSFTTQGYQVSKWTIQNNTSTPLEVKEEDFYQPHDVALALGQTTLAVGESTTLYAVSRCDASRYNTSPLEKGDLS